MKRLTLLALALSVFILPADAQRSCVIITTESRFSSTNLSKCQEWNFHAFKPIEPERTNVYATNITVRTWTNTWSATSNEGGSNIVYNISGEIIAIYSVSNGFSCSSGSYLYNLTNVSSYRKGTDAHTNTWGGAFTQTSDGRDEREGWYWIKYGPNGSPCEYIQTHYEGQSSVSQEVQYCVHQTTNDWDWHWVGSQNNWGIGVP